MLRGVLEFWFTHRAEMGAALLQHVGLVLASTMVACLIGLPLGVLATRRPRLAAPLLGLAGIVQTIPSLAMFGFLIPLPLIGGVGARTALVVLVLYALLPVMRTTVAGIQGIDRAVREVGVAMGMTDGQLLRWVELPLAAGSIMAGIRVATVVGVGAATIAAAIGAGGLGEYIFRGLSMVNPTIILAGAIPAAMLALGADLMLGAVARRLEPGRRRHGSRTLIVAAGVLIAIVFGAYVANARGSRTVVVGSKNFTEQFVLGEVVAQWLEATTDLRVGRRLNLGGTFICDAAVRSGEIDLYVEYTGTALTAILKRPVTTDESRALSVVSDAYKPIGLTVAPPLGFNNTFAILMRRADAERRRVATLSDLAGHAPSLRAGFGYEFLERADGFTGLARTYGLRFAEPPHVMDLTLSYRALAAGKVDVIAGDMTSGLIPALDLLVLKDNRSYFPPYHAVPIVRTQTLARYPAVRASLARLSAQIPDDVMRRMNHEADVLHKDPKAIAREFVAEKLRRGT